MKLPTYLFPFTQDLQKSYPHYYDHGFVLHKIQSFLYQHVGQPFRIFNYDEDWELIWDTVEEDQVTSSPYMQVLGHVYECLNTGEIKIKSSQSSERVIHIGTSLTNTLYYYPTFQVCIVKIPIFQAHEDYEEKFLFSTSDRQIEPFFNYIQTRQRELVTHQLHIFVDTEDGIERRKEMITEKVSREDVMMEHELKKEIFRSIDEFFTENGQFFRKYRLPYKRGILLYGKPGNGKTTLVKSIANSVSAPVLYWQITEHTSSYTIHQMFSKAMYLAPVVLVIEDIDSMPEEVRSYFLNTLDGAASNEGVFLIGTTNYPERIDPALMNRAGRFDRAYEMRLPDAQLRRAYLEKRHLLEFISEDEFMWVVEKTDDFSFAQLNELYASIALQYHYDGQVDIKSIVTRMYADNKKGKKREWSTDQGRVGFF